MHAPFVHLRLHSAYSLAESTLRIKQLAALVSGDRQPAAAITDTNNMFGALEFSQAMVAAGVQPIIGTQMTLSDSDGNGEVVLLAMDATGYTNLCQLQSEALLQADATSDPAASMEMLAAHADGLLVLSGGAMAGFVAAPAADGRLALSRKRLEALVAICPGRVYVELQRHGMSEEDRAEDGLLALAVELELPLVATNDCRYDTPEMHQPHDALICIGTGRKMSEDDRIRYSSQHYFRTAGEMGELFADIPEAISNSLVTARRCSVMAEERAPILPAFTRDERRSEPAELGF